MDARSLKGLYEHSGPFASVYLDTQRTDAQAAQAIELRWRQLRRQLAADGADEPTLRALDGAVGSDRGLPAPKGQAIFASNGEIVLTEELRIPPAADQACFTRLPHVLPLLAQWEDFPPYLLVATDRAGADLEVRLPAGPRVSAQVEGETDELHKAAFGGSYVEARHQRRVENQWERNAREVTRQIEELGTRYRVGMIVLTGDVRARSLIREQLGPAWRDKVVELPTGGRAEGTDQQLAEAAAQAVVAEAEAAVRAEVRRRFERSEAHGEAVHGLDPTVEALRRAQVDTLIMADSAADGAAKLWWSPEPPMIATNRQELTAGGATEVYQDQAADVLIRAVADTAAQLMVVSGGEPAPPEGIGAILRARSTGQEEY
jgi:hypothetical protein